MATTPRSPFERLQSRYSEVDLVCPKCGYDDDGGSWQAVTSGKTVEYRHVCPGCGAIRRRTVTLDRD
ncbi:HVO_0649 family zinc finger protein [Halobellus sp. EA9]|uniref:HVO_0649 family zinc finger protein n=1 Tax=Halobellus sp. EA9 TaxID=3421647 RepID=UPI003EB7E9AA